MNAYEMNDNGRIQAMEVLHRMNQHLLKARNYSALKIGQQAFECVFHDVPESKTFGFTLEQFRSFKMGVQS